MSVIDEVIEFWLSEVGPKGWYISTEALDQKIRNKYMDLWSQALNGGLHEWTSDPRGALAYLLVTDQFPRNMFREDPRAFATDPRARAVAKHAVDVGFDMKIEEPERQFFYLPLMHSECLTDQDRCVRLILTRMPKDGGSNLLHARAHRRVIRRYGRFPYRNNALARCSSEDEKTFLEQSGYGGIVEELKSESD